MEIPNEEPAPQNLAVSEESSNRTTAPLPESPGSLAVEAAVLFLVFCTLALALARTPVDTDLWGHLRFGLDTLQAREIIRTDPYSYTAAGLPWINHEWLAEVLFALAWQAAGASGLILLKMLAWLATLAIMTGYLLKIGLPVLRASLLVLPAFLLMLLGAGTVRPQMFTGLGFALTILAIVLAEDGSGRRPLASLWGLPLVFALWANLHGGFLSGLLFLVVWAFLYLLAHKEHWLQVLPPVLLSLAAVCLNPYGIELLLFLARTAVGARPEIKEWAPLVIQSWLGILYLMMVFVTLLAVIKVRRQPVQEGSGSLNFSRLALIGLAAILPLLAQRHIVLFGIAIPLLAGPAFRDLWQSTPRPARFSRWILALVTFSLGLLMLIKAATFLDRIEMPGNGLFPVAAVAFLQQSGVEGNLAVHFNWGEYAIWHLCRQVKVSLDGRRETVYPDEIYRQNLRFFNGAGSWDDLLTLYHTDMALLPRGSPGDNLLRLKPEWTLVYQDEGAVLFAKRGSLPETRLLVAAPHFQPPASADSFP